MRRIGAVLLVVFLLAGLVACGASVKEREREALLAAGGDRVYSSESIFRGMYIHVVCKNNVPVLVITSEGFFWGTEISKKMILDPNDIFCVKK